MEEPVEIEEEEKEEMMELEEENDSIRPFTLKGKCVILLSIIIGDEVGPFDAWSNREECPDHCCTVVLESPSPP